MALLGATLAGILGLAACRPLLMQDVEVEMEEPAPAAETAPVAPAPEESAPSARADSGPSTNKPEPSFAWPPLTGPGPMPMPPSAILPPLGPGMLPPGMGPAPGPGMPPPMGMPGPMPSPGPGMGPAPGPGMPPPMGMPGPVPSPGFGAPPGATPESPIRQVLDLAYGTAERQRVDIYVPASEEPAAILLFIHGGAWASGDKSEYAWLGQQLSRQGLLVAIANYRLSPSVQHPTHAQDVATATAWLHRHAPTFGGDPTRLYLAGHSAGAHLVSLVSLDGNYLAAAGADPSIIHGVAGFAGAAYDIDARYMGTPLAPLFAPAFGTDPARWAAAAPLSHVKPGAPPFLLVHGLNDNQAPASSAQAFAEALKREGVPTTLQLLPGVDHFTALLTATTSISGFVQDTTPSAREVRDLSPRGPRVSPGRGV